MIPPAEQVTPELLPVTEADREAAANYTGFDQERYLNRDLDHGETVQAFARHRLAHATPAPEGLAEAVRALQPFADALNDDPDADQNARAASPIWEASVAMAITFGDLRCARDAHRLLLAAATTTGASDNEQVSAAVPVKYQDERRRMAEGGAGEGNATPDDPAPQHSTTTGAQSGAGGLRERARQAVELLANTPMALPLEDWDRASNDLLAAIDATLPPPVEQPAGEAPKRVRELNCGKNDMLISILVRVDPNAPVEMQTYARGQSSRDPMSFMKRAARSLAAEMGDYKNCPHHAEQPAGEAMRVETIARIIMERHEQSRPGKEPLFLMPWELLKDSTYAGTARAIVAALASSNAAGDGK